MTTKPFFNSIFALAAVAAWAAGAGCIAEIGADPDGIRPIISPAPGRTGSGDTARTADAPRDAVSQSITVEVRGLGRKPGTVGTSLNLSELSFHIESVRGFGDDLDSSGEDLGGMTFESFDGEPSFESPRKGSFSGALKKVKRVGIDFSPSPATLDGRASDSRIDSPGASVVLRGAFSFPRSKRSKPSHPTPSPDHPTPSPDHPTPSPDTPAPPTFERSDVGDIESLPFVFRDSGAIAVRATLEQIAIGDVRQIVIVIDLDKIVDAELFNLFDRASHESQATELLIGADSTGSTLALFDGMRNRFSSAISIELR
ncbi:MAG: hypothetical protein HYY84_06345 [Deltaproteobacteria bacterium]|nr:hypothetical protein [Deltaproteobacteria bacterium]